MQSNLIDNCLDLRGIKIYLDMDGVVANFIDKYLELAEDLKIKYKGSKTDNTANPVLFRIAVLEHDIFRSLQLMPCATMLVNYLIQIQSETGLEIEMLTSVNSNDLDIIRAASQQKNEWLKKNNIPWKANFVKTNFEKSEYAALNTLLIDDNEQCTQPFLDSKGFAIRYDHFNQNFMNNLIATLKEMQILELDKVS